MLGASLTGLGGRIATPIGVGPRYHPPAAPARVLRGEPVGGLRCRAGGQRFGVHVELFAHAPVVVVPAGGGAPPPRPPGRAGPGPPRGGADPAGRPAPP